MSSERTRDIGRVEPVLPISAADSFAKEYEAKHKGEKRCAWYSLSGLFTATWLQLRAALQSIASDKPYHVILATIINDQIARGAQGQLGTFEHAVTGKSLRWFDEKIIKQLNTRNREVQAIIIQAIFHSQSPEIVTVLASSLVQARAATIPAPQARMAHSNREAVLPSFFVSDTVLVESLKNCLGADQDERFLPISEQVEKLVRRFEFWSPSKEVQRELLGFPLMSELFLFEHAEFPRTIKSAELMIQMIKDNCREKSKTAEGRNEIEVFKTYLEMHAQDPKMGLRYRELLDAVFTPKGAVPPSEIHQVGQMSLASPSLRRENRVEEGSLREHLDISEDVPKTREILRYLAPESGLPIYSHVRHVAARLNKLDSLEDVEDVLSSLPLQARLFLYEQISDKRKALVAETILFEYSHLPPATQQQFKEYLQLYLDDKVVGVRYGELLQQLG